MIVVSNTSPIINLACVGQLDLLRQIHGAITIPEAVFTEITVNGIGQPGAEEVSRLPWIVRHRVTQTRGIVLGSAPSFLSGTDAFFLRCAFLITTRGNHTHLYCGFRSIGAYADAKTNTDHLAAYDDKVALGIKDNAGALARHTSIATADAATNAAHAAAANNDVLALEVSVAASRVTTCKIGHATPAGASAAEYEAARIAAIADLATDATIAASAKSVTTAINFVPYICYGMKGTAATSDTRLMSFECDYA